MTPQGIDHLRYKTCTVLLIDSHGESHYTSYLAFGLSQYRNVILYGFSKEAFDIVRHGMESHSNNNITFYSLDVGTEKSSIRKSKDPIISFPFKSLAKIKYDLIQLGGLLRALTKRNYGIVHIQGHQPLFFLFVPILKLRKKKIYWTIHDVHPRASSTDIVGRLGVFYAKAISQLGILIKHADGIIVHGSFLKDQLTSRGVPEEKILVLPHFDYRYLLKYQSSETGFKLAYSDYVLQFGRMAPYKGVYLLIDAARIVRRRLGNSTRLNVVITGAGNASNYLNYLDDYDKEYIHLFNMWIPSSDVAYIIKNAKCLILPYTEASQSGVVSLAYTFSKPVIVSRVGSIAEYVEHNKTGFVFELGDAEQLAGYIIELITNDTKCLEMGRRANEKLNKEMSIEVCAKAINRLYSQMKMKA